MPAYVPAPACSSPLQHPRQRLILCKMGRHRAQQCTHQDIANITWLNGKVKENQEHALSHDQGGFVERPRRGRALLPEPSIERQNCGAMERHRNTADGLQAWAQGSGRAWRGDAAGVVPREASHVHLVDDQVLHGQLQRPVPLPVEGAGRGGQRAGRLRPGTRHAQHAVAAVRQVLGNAHQTTVLGAPPREFWCEESHSQCVEFLTLPAPDRGMQGRNATNNWWSRMAVSGPTRRALTWQRQGYGALARVRLPFVLILSQVLGPGAGARAAWRHMQHTGTGKLAEIHPSRAIRAVHRHWRRDGPTEFRSCFGRGLLWSQARR